MVEMLLSGAELLFTFNTMILLTIGLFLGIVVGATPGFSSSNGTAVMLPLTLGMSTEGSIVFIAAVYCGAMYGDAVPAVLFKTPGSAGAGATAIDGFPMAQQGKADQALGLSLGASSIGSLISVVLVIFAIKPMAGLALRFGPAEMFLLALLGIAVIASVVGDDVKKGLMAALIGLLVAAMPADPMMSRPRLNFGMIELYDQVPMIPALIGVFAIPTLIALAVKLRIADVSGDDVAKVGDIRSLWQGVVMAIKRPVNIVRSALIGAFIGAIPGTGASIATFVSYGQARIWSKDPKSFGKGNPDGVIASEAANNGVTSGSMIPAIALGIPGSGTTAVMLAALILHGVRPGPHVIRDSPDLVYALLLSLLLGAVLLLPLGMLFNMHASKITVVKTGYMLPALLALSLLGAFATRIYVFDIWLALIFGVIGIIMVRQNFPVVPLIMGIILGPLAEGNYARAVAISGNNISTFTSSTISIILWAVIIIVLAAPIFGYVKSKLELKKSNA